jgi:hypothetical protein
MAMQQKVSGVGKNSSRSDQNIVERTQRVQREANMANATGGPQGSSKTNRELSQGGAMATTASAVSADAATRSMINQTNVVSPFAPGSPDRPATDGMGGNTPGKTPNDLMANYNSSDAGSILVRAMYAAYPTPELRRYVEAYNEEGMF